MDEDEEFDWDEAKAESNYRKHGVDFGAAYRAFFDPLALHGYDELALRTVKIDSSWSEWPPTSS